MKIEVNGISYPSMSEAAFKLNVKLPTVKGRLDRGWNIDEAFGVIKHESKKPVSIVVNDITYPSVYAAAKEYGLSYHSVYNKLKNGHTIDEAFGFKKHIHKGKSVKINNITYSSISDAAKKLNINISKVFTRLNDSWSLDEAFEIIPRSTFTVNGNIFRSRSSACDYYKISKSTVYSRLRAGWTIDEAFEIVERKRS